MAGRQAGEREARQIAEEARETGWDQPSFGKQLFLGDFRLDLIHPHPRPGEESSRRGEEFFARIGRLRKRFYTAPPFVAAQVAKTELLPPLDHPEEPARCSESPLIA